MNKSVNINYAAKLLIIFLLLLATNLSGGVGTSLFESTFQIENLILFNDVKFYLTLLTGMSYFLFILMTFRMEAVKCIKYVLTTYACLTFLLGFIAIPIHMIYQTGLENQVNIDGPISLILYHWPISLNFVLNQFMNPVSAMFFLWAYFNQHTKLSEAIRYYVPISIGMVIVQKILEFAIPTFDVLFTNDLHQLIVHTTISILLTSLILRIMSKNNQVVIQTNDLNIDKTNIRDIILPLGFIGFISFVIMGLLVFISIPTANIKPLLHSHKTMIELGGLVIAIIASLLVTPLLRTKGWKSTVKIVTIILFSLIGLVEGILYFSNTDAENLIVFVKMLEAGTKDAIMLGLLQIAIVAFSKENRLKIQSWVCFIIQPVLAYVMIMLFAFTKIVGLDSRIALLLIVIGGYMVSLYSIKIIGKQYGLTRQNQQIPSI